ncbi:hypothetical protein T4A_852 [Trichinella pseudospiralis]|uniref:Uncharacterized protein n=1 Tax=Trichinella pseudospiralis TaxID=6337 RepID=A0A0V1E0G8_TRIPS|nr:hypothetical protein T4A_852 [Trichinella pseudospiralis]
MLHSEQTQFGDKSTTVNTSAIVRKSLFYKLRTVTVRLYNVTKKILRNIFRLLRSIFKDANTQIDMDRLHLSVPDNVSRRTRNSNTSEPLKRRDDRGLCRTPVASAIFSTLTSLVIVFGWPSADICASQKDSK